MISVLKIMFTQYSHQPWFIVCSQKINLLCATHEWCNACTARSCVLVFRYQILHVQMLHCCTFTFCIVHIQDFRHSIFWACDSAHLNVACTRFALLLVQDLRSCANKVCVFAFARFTLLCMRGLYLAHTSFVPLHVQGLWFRAFRVSVFHMRGLRSCVCRICAFAFSRFALSRAQGLPSCVYKACAFAHSFDLLFCSIFHVQIELTGFIKIWTYYSANFRSIFVNFLSVSFIFIIIFLLSVAGIWKFVKWLLANVIFETVTMGIRGTHGMTWPCSKCWGKLAFLSLELFRWLVVLIVDLWSLSRTDIAHNEAFLIPSSVITNEIPSRMDSTRPSLISDLDWAANPRRLYTCATTIAWTLTTCTNVFTFSLWYAMVGLAGVVNTHEIHSRPSMRDGSFMTVLCVK